MSYVLAIEQPTYEIVAVLAGLQWSQRVTKILERFGPLSVVP